MASNNIINISTTKPKLSVIGFEDPGGLKLKSPMTAPASAPKKSVNFGPGLELLMNPKKANASPKADISMSDLDALENKINKTAGLSKADLTKKIFSTPSLEELGTGNNMKLNISELPAKPVSSGERTINLGKKTENPEKDVTWDGYKKFNEIPVNPQANVPVKPKLSAEETVREKINLIRKLEHLEKKGIKVTKKYTMEDPLAAVKAEYDMLKKEKEKKNSVKFQGKMLMAFVSALEFLNGRFDPFELKLDGWAEAVNENIEDYDDVFGELHEKYGEKAKMAPELKLLFMLGGSAAMLHMTNTMFKSAMPGMDDIMRQNPELMSQFTQAAANTMSRDNPGFGSFMNNMMNSRPDPPMGAPQGPSDSHKNNPPMPPMGRPRFPDVGMTRGSPNFNDAVNMDHRQADPFKTDRDRQNRRKRPEMQGPKDLDDILANLKTKKINLQNRDDNKSVSSIGEIKELDTGKPPKTKRKSHSRSSRASGGVTMSLNGLV